MKTQKNILGLKMVTDPLWVKNVVQHNIEDILTDHAYCEQKAASNAISLIIAYPQYPDLVSTMSALAIEEMQHFKMVHEHIIKRGFELGRERKDEYVNQILKFIRKGISPEITFLDRLLFAAMIEARSCERFKVLEEHIKDKELSLFYHELMISEAKHYTSFITLAKKYIDPQQVNLRWEQYLSFEAKVIVGYGKQGRIHG